MTTTTTSRFDRSGYKFPKCYDEVNAMIQASSLIYVVAEMRSMARRQGLPPTDEEYKDYGLTECKTLLTLPISARDTLAYIDANKDALMKSKEFDGKDLETLKALEVVVNRQVSSTRAVLEVFSDEFEEEELVYAITADENLKRITVTFRGSDTGLDWRKDFQIWMNEVDNPLREHYDDVPAKISLHHGFYDYLFGGKFSKSVSYMSKFEEIIAQLLDVMKKPQYKGYNLYIAGHSLGGALSTVFSYFVTSTKLEEVKSPVTNISIASPYCGDSNWRDSFMKLEQEGMLRHIRVSNDGDFVPLVPFVSVKALKQYKHVGLNLKLYKINGWFNLGRSLRWSWTSGIVNSLFNAQSQSFLANFSTSPVSNHGCDEYSKRLDHVKADVIDLDTNAKYEEFMSA